MSSSSSFSSVGCSCAPGTGVYASGLMRSMVTPRSEVCLYRTYLVVVSGEFALKIENFMIKAKGTAGVAKRYPAPIRAGGSQSRGATTDGRGRALLQYYIAIHAHLRHLTLIFMLTKCRASSVYSLHHVRKFRSWSHRFGVGDAE
ncbi:hypothetical protein E2C01_017538 [Portunus trituberculatus]|uniref:Uncharacterized protein n=1 Tax=Portunus trituberculatus TaxID=210409 RepID=A0A5B7DU32_PORTR|nr:hypothetical protein [Portunus trituberculatus]